MNKELNERLNVLYRQHNEWLLKVAFNITKDVDTSRDLVSELYLYLAEKGNEKLYYLNSFNLIYCRAYIKTRWLNRIKRDKRLTDKVPDTEDVVYDKVWDKKLDDTYKEVINELDKLKGTKLWSSAKLFEMYWFGEDTMETLSDKINISKSTTFINVKKIKQHLKNNIDNPFLNQNE
jgi:DNA-directed RNA polymerase specialized sigma24 family protein